MLKAPPDLIKEILRNIDAPCRVLAQRRHWEVKLAAAQDCVTLPIASLRWATQSVICLVHPHFKKYSHFSFYPNHLHIPHRLVPQRGGSRSSRTRGGMRWTRAHQARERDGRAGRKACERSNGARTNDVACGRRSRVVLTPRRWRQGGGRHLCPTGLSRGASFRRRRWQSSPVTGESTKETVKTIACGNAG
jgi:hypothetical protein